MEVVKTIQAVRKLVNAARSRGKTIGLVPTMGGLHAGHVSLIEKAGSQTDFVLVSIFVNPTQFGPNEDFEKYPRKPESDLKICEEAGAAVVFVPPVNEIYHEKELTWVTVEKLTDLLCGRDRPNHFRGVTTVCAKLFNIVMPDVAFFGQKDAQQALVIKQMVTDLNMPLEIAVCPTVREKDGLAVSSRNSYLTAEQRAQAPLLYESLEKCEELIKQGVCDTKTLIDEMRNILAGGKDIKIDYINIVNAQSLTDISVVTGKALVAVAAKVGNTRLIDNIMVDLKKV